MCEELGVYFLFGSMKILATVQAGQVYLNGTVKKLKQKKMCGYGDTVILGAANFISTNKQKQCVKNNKFF